MIFMDFMFCLNVIFKKNIRKKRKILKKEKLMKQETINILEIFEKDFPPILVKDLQENERVCPVCKGLGMKIEDNIYGVKGDTSEAGRKYRFPYKHQSFSFCPSCYNGVQRLCPYCGKPYKYQGIMHCDCKTQKKLDEENISQYWQEKLDKAVEIEESEVKTMLYCREFDKYYSSVAECMEEWEDYYCHQFSLKERPQKLWVTTAIDLHIDAETVIEEACEDMYEDAIECIDETEQDELQEMLNKWCDRQGMTTYYPCYEKYVTIPWPTKGR